MDLKSVRQEIDCLDTKILKLLNERMEKAIISRKFKTEVEDNKREEIIINRIRSNAKGLISLDFCEKLFKEIISESKNLQKQNKILIGFQGVSGAYSELVAKKWNKDYVPVSNNSFAEVFQGVENGIFDYGIVPVENTLMRRDIEVKLFPVLGDEDNGNAAAPCKPDFQLPSVLG